MLNLYKENYYNVGELLAVLQELPKDYKIQVYSEDFESHSGKVNDINIDHNEKTVDLWFG